MRMATIWLNPGYDKKGFSGIELRDMAISVAALSLAFTIIYCRTPGFFSPDFAINAICWFLASVVIVSVCFLLHEFGHKFAAQRYGAWAEYRMSPQGLALSVACSFFGFLVAAPGAVYINGYIDDRRNGIISIAGPAVNLVLGSIFIVLAFATDGRIGDMFYLLAHFNAFLAAFNMIPVPPLDGSKILKWNPAVYGIAAVFAVALLLLFYVRF